MQINDLHLHEMILNISPYTYVAYDCMVVFVLLHHETKNLIFAGKLHIIFQCLCTSLQAQTIWLCCAWLQFVVFKPGTCPGGTRQLFSNFTSASSCQVTYLVCIFSFPFVTGQQGEICPVPGEGVPSENQPSLHVWRPREEDPRIQAPAP